MTLIEAKSNDDFVDILDKYPNVIAYFTAIWCGACKSISPKLDAIVSRYTREGLIFVKVDAGKCDKVMDICCVTELPTFAMFINGKEENRVIGSDLSNIIANIDKIYL